MTTMNGNELYHYGVPGMRWGVRKSNNARVVNGNSTKKLNKHTKMVDQLKKSGELYKDSEKYEIDYDRSKHIKPPKNSSTKSTPKNESTNKTSNDDSTKKPSKNDKKTKQASKKESTNEQVKEQIKDSSKDKKDKLQESIANTNATKNVLNDSSRIFNEASNMASRTARDARSKPSEKVKKELSEMDDKELQRRINRIRMEREYTDLNPSERAMAAERTSRVLNNIGSLLAVGGSIASIALTLQQLKANKSK